MSFRQGLQGERPAVTLSGILPFPLAPARASALPVLALRRITALKLTQVADEALHNSAAETALQLAATAPELRTEDVTRQHTNAQWMGRAIWTLCAAFQTAPPGSLVFVIEPYEDLAVVINGVAIPRETLIRAALYPKQERPQGQQAINVITRLLEPAWQASVNASGTPGFTPVDLFDQELRRSAEQFTRRQLPTRQLLERVK